jgi:hypothetical protein
MSGRHPAPKKQSTRFAIPPRTVLHTAGVLHEVRVKKAKNALHVAQSQLDNLESLERGGMGALNDGRALSNARKNRNSKQAELNHLLAEIPELNGMMSRIRIGGTRRKRRPHSKTLSKKRR